MLPRTRRVVDDLRWGFLAAALFTTHAAHCRRNQEGQEGALTDSRIAAWAECDSKVSVCSGDFRMVLTGWLVETSPDGKGYR